MCWGTLLNSIICLLINTHYTGKIIQVGFLKQMKDLIPILILSLAMGTAVWALVTFIPMPSGGALAAGIGLGLFFYILISRLFRFNEFSVLLSIIKKDK